MRFKDRIDAGKQLCQRLKKYKDQNVVIYALPRGGVVVAAEIAKALNAPLDLIFAHKIGHPYHAEYAIAAICESGQLLATAELESFGKSWLEKAIHKELLEIKRKKDLYLCGRQHISPKDKTVLIVDDGIATGLTLQAGILELRNQSPKKIVAIVPIAPKNTADHIKNLVDDFIAVEILTDFQGAVGAYYQKFDQVEDEEVIKILDRLS